MAETADFANLTYKPTNLIDYFKKEYNIYFIDKNMTLRKIIYFHKNHSNDLQQ